MELLSTIKTNFADKFSNRKYFSKFFKGRSQDEIVSAIQELRILRNNISQSQLAEQCGMKPSAVCRLEKPEYGRWNFQTLWRIAEALDARWRFILEPRESVIESYMQRELPSNGINFSIQSINNAEKTIGNQILDGPSLYKEKQLERTDQKAGTLV